MPLLRFFWFVLYKDSDLYILAPARNTGCMIHFDPRISYFGKVDFRDDNRHFGIYQHDRLFGMYMLGKTGSGKTTLMKTLLYQDLVHGRGVCLFDIHGDLVKEVMELVPEHRKKDVVYLNATTPSLALGYNPLKKVSYHKRALIASGILETFQKLWGAQAWGAKLEYILRNTLLTLLDQDGATFNDIPKLLIDPSFRTRCLPHVVDPTMVRFWKQEFPNYSRADILPVLNKVGSFLSIPVLYKILVENTQQISLRTVMDTQKILLVNLSKGSLGADGAHLLGSLLLTSLASASFNRVDVHERKRVPFFIYLDEFHNYVTASLVGMLSELRKFGIGFILAHQYLNQLKPDIRNAVLGNIGTTVCFRLGHADSTYMAHEFSPMFQSSDFTSLEHYHIYLKLMINGKVSPAFSAKTLVLPSTING